ncbi:MAG: metallophosphoesterase, partial [Lentisphaeria bacterium]|nr:metallophosphoesterase [Lentisphaeria bacterium]
MKKHPVRRPLLFLIFIFFFSLNAAPVLRIGIFSDTHVTEDKNSCILLEKSLNLFKDKKADMVINAGDIADVYNIRAYRNYRETVNNVYQNNKKPQEIFVYANHDRLNRRKESVWQVFKDVKKYLEIPNDPYDVIKFRGYTFVVIPQFADMARYKAMLDKAVRENPGKPVFVI